MNQRYNMAPEASLFIGLEYPDSDIALYSTALDVQHMRAFLGGVFPNMDARLLLDKTRVVDGKEIITELEKLLMDESSTSKLIFYAGHGSDVCDSNGDELSGRDQVLVPGNHNRTGFVSDDVLKQLLSRVPASARVTIVLDCCHSGTMFDLPFTYSANSSDQSIVSNKIETGDIACKVVVMTACSDNQATPETINGGLFTSSLLEHLRETPATAATAFNALRAVARRMPGQTPTLNSSFAMDETSLLFI